MVSSACVAALALFLGCPHAHAHVHRHHVVAGHHRVHSVRERVLARGHGPAGYTETGEASFYGPGFQGRRTACGNRFNMNEISVAHRTLPCGTMVKVTDLKSGRSITARVEDWGPARWTHRIADLSRAAARALGMGGLARVRVEIIR